MTEKNTVYKCGACGNTVVVLYPGGGTLVCCNQPMTLQVENSTGAAPEKHVPVLEQTSTGYEVMVGSVAHPMEEEHYIEWIEINDDGKTCRNFLKPGERPQAVFNPPKGKMTARAFCNLHGLWKGE